MRHSGFPDKMGNFSGKKEKKADLCKKGEGTFERGFRRFLYYDLSPGEVVWQDRSPVHVRKGFLDMLKSQM